MRHYLKAIALIAIIALAVTPVHAGPGCGVKASTSGGKAQESGHACAYKAGSCGFTEAFASAACCKSGKSGFHKATKVEIVETGDGYIAIATADSPKTVQALQSMARTGLEALTDGQKEKKHCPLCDEMKGLIDKGARVEIYDTANGVVVVARSQDEGVVEGLHAYASKIRAAETQDKAEATSEG